MRQTREAMVRTMGVKMQAKRPSLPILVVLLGSGFCWWCCGAGETVVKGSYLNRCIKRVYVKPVDVCKQKGERERERAKLVICRKTSRLSCCEMF